VLLQGDSRLDAADQAGGQRRFAERERATEEPWQRRGVIRVTAGAAGLLQLLERRRRPLAMAAREQHLGGRRDPIAINSGPPVPRAIATSCSAAVASAPSPRLPRRASWTERASMKVE